MRERRPFRLQNGVTVEVVRTGAPFQSGSLADGVWPCLGCGQHRAIELARDVTVREAGEPPMQRHILLCEPCLERSRDEGLGEPQQA